MPIPDALAAARLRAAHERPYLAAALWSLVPIEVKDIGTFAVDKYWRLYYDPACFDKWKPEEVAAVLIHEITHLLRDHAGRAEALQPDHEIWCLATDAAINDDLVLERLPLPGKPARWPVTVDQGATFLVPSTFGLPDGRCEEEYYAEIAKKFERQPSPGGSAKKPGEGQGEAAGGGGSRGKKSEDEDEDGSGDGDEEDTEDDEGESQGEGEGDGDGKKDQPKPEGQGQGKDEGEEKPQPPRPGSGNCGSCADDKRRPWEADAPNEPNAPEGMKRAEHELLRRHIAKEIRDAAKARGDMPGGWKEWANELLEPTVDWRREFAGAVRGAMAEVAGCVDYSYRRPSRRQAAFPDVVLPSMRAPVPRATCILDTSGSVGTTEFGEAIGEVTGMLKQCGFRDGLQVLAVDAAVQRVKRIASSSGLRDMLVGRGGTDMRVGIEAAVALRPRPDFVIVLTDGYTPWPVAKPEGVKIIVVLVGRAGPETAASVPTWARTIVRKERQSANAR